MIKNKMLERLRKKITNNINDHDWTTGSRTIEKEDKRDFTQLWDTVFVYLMVLFIGIALGYGWCFLALTGK